MYFNKAKYGAATLVFLSAFSSTPTFSGTMGEVNPLFKGHFLVQIGGYSAIQGKTQDIYIRENLLGNRYTVKTHNQGSGLVGLGYLIDGPVIQNRFPISYGIDAFFLGQTSVSGYIEEEHMFTNLSYRYKLQNIPVYLDAKTVVDTNFDKIKLAIDVGIGPNFMSASRYFETALTPFTIPDNAFSSRNNVAFSATVGASLRFNNVIGQLPIELGYRFFYLGQGRFKVNNEQVLNSVKTGENYANALVCTVIL
jgi:hypothetical protein